MDSHPPRDDRPQPTDTQPLAGIQVIDLSRLVSGNILTHALADLGARVIKIESPGKGDELRGWRRKGVSTYWLAYARNKDSVALDLRDQEGQAHLRRGAAGTLRALPFWDTDQNE
jgi:formyl-CoA transferase